MKNHEIEVEKLLTFRSLFLNGFLPSTPPLRGGQEGSAEAAALAFRAASCSTTSGGGGPPYPGPPGSGPGRWRGTSPPATGCAPSAPAPGPGSCPKAADLQAHIDGQQSHQGVQAGLVPHKLGLNHPAEDADHPHTASMAMPRSQLPMAMRTMDQGTITVPEPMMGIKSMTPSSTASRMP